MAINYPTSLDTFVDVTPNSVVPSSGWNNIQDAIEALEAKVGINNSTDTNSLDYKIAQISPSRFTTIENNIASLQSTKQDNLRVCRLSITATSSSTATLEVFDLYNGDSCSSQSVGISYSGTYYYVRTLDSSGKIRMNSEIFSPSITAILFHIPNCMTSTSLKDVRTTVSISSGGILTTFVLTSISTLFSTLYSSSNKVITIDYVYV